MSFILDRVITSVEDVMNSECIFLGMRAGVPVVLCPKDTGVARTCG